MKGLLFGFLVLIVFLVFIIPPVFIYQECKYNETFTDKINSIYEEWTKELKYLKNKFEIGLPSGILKYKKNMAQVPLGNSSFDIDTKEDYFNYLNSQN